MVVILLVLFSGFILYVGFKSYKSEVENLALSAIRSKYQLKSDINKIKTVPDILYFWTENSEKSYINGLQLFSGTQGLYIKGGMMHRWFKPTFIPWNELEERGKMRFLFFIKLKVYYLSSIKTYIAFPERYSIAKGAKL